MRRVRVKVTLRELVDRTELCTARLGPLEIVATEGNPWSVSRLTVAMPESWQVEQSNDLKHMEIVLALVRAEFDKRGWKVDGVATVLEGRR